MCEVRVLQVRNELVVKCLSRAPRADVGWPAITSWPPKCFDSLRREGSGIQVCGSILLIFLEPRYSAPSFPEAWETPLSSNKGQHPHPPADPLGGPGRPAVEAAPHPRPTWETEALRDSQH